MKPNRALPLLAALPAVLLLAQVYLTCGFVYSLDDPYIHLALARRIWQGHYGINPGEFAAPSSSILWPFLLAPFASSRIGEFVPLIVNIAALTTTVWLIQRWLEGHMQPVWALVATTAAAFLLNLYGLPLNGMEHSLQVMMVVVIALSLVRGEFAWPFWLSVVLLPLVRYEGLAISLPTLAHVAFMPRYRVKAIAAVLAIVLLVGGFSFFLHDHSAEFLPSSVLSKLDLGAAARPSLGEQFVENVAYQLFFVVIAIFAAVLFVQNGKAREAILLVVVPMAGHLLFGRYGWFGRYHIYFSAWIAILFCSMYWRSRLQSRPVLNVALALAAVAGSTQAMSVTLATPMSSRNVADQQYQMAIIARDYLDEPVAVNDLGFVSFLARNYVLDLYGLGSYEVLRARASDPSEQWIGRMMASRNVEQVMIYDRFFKRLPANWIRVATLTLPTPRVVVADDHVTFYSTSAEAAVRLRAALAAYRKRSDLAGMMLALEPQ